MRKAPATKKEHLISPNAQSLSSLQSPRHGPEAFSRLADDLTVRPL